MIYIFKRFALKSIEFNDNNESKDIINETRFMKDLDHDNIVKYYGHFEGRNSFVKCINIVLELCKVNIKQSFVF